VEPKPGDFKTLYEQVLYGGHRNKLLVAAISVNMLFVLVRPQYQLKFLETIKFPFMLALIPFALWLPKAPRGWAPQMKAMFAIILMGLLWVPLAKNNRMAFEGFRVIAQFLLMIAFPLAMTFQGRKWLDKLFRLFLFTALYLSLYGVTHGGRGPGDYLGDENDLALVLNMHLGLLLGLLSAPQSSLRKLLILMAIGGIIASIVVTGSRGGFLGMVSVLGFHILHAKRKVGFFFLAVIIASLTFVLAPAKYWDRIYTIKDTNTGTARERMETWGFAWDVFTKPKNFLVGTGMKNGPLQFGEYRTWRGRNMWGRQTHSLYFEILPDLGLIGFSLFLYIVLKSFNGNRRSIKSAEDYLRRIRGAGLKTPEDRLLLLELNFLRSSMISINAAWIGTLICAGFISVFYYPPIWILACVSVAMQGYSRRVLKLAEYQLSANVKLVTTEEPQRLVF
jgi:hypothetical protein